MGFLKNKCRAQRLQEKQTPRVPVHLGTVLTCKQPSPRSHKENWGKAQLFQMRVLDVLGALKMPSPFCSTGFLKGSSCTQGPHAINISGQRASWLICHYSGSSFGAAERNSLGRKQWADNPNLSISACLTCPTRFLHPVPLVPPSSGAGYSDPLHGSTYPRGPSR